MVKFKTNKETYRLVDQIAERAFEVAKGEGIDYPLKSIQMDVLACHLNGCPLDLSRLLSAPPDDFAHDIFGIRRFIDRSTGKIDPRKFDPRCSLPVWDKRINLSWNDLQASCKCLSKPMLIKLIRCLKEAAIRDHDFTLACRLRDWEKRLGVKPGMNKPARSAKTATSKR